ncbi:hypothetical protein FSARC_7834 [Fusarium sarcochroum]|uniref:Uncharacterized protein n=1 Tax=Fusarium sarcochroum TaxID=1208366 RepID=A0A8H4TU96_9HYPO|nr:hypothetical protein FSARC_7834 [Fusarium sarcochroum]
MASQTAFPMMKLTRTPILAESNEPRAQLQDQPSSPPLDTQLEEPHNSTHLTKDQYRCRIFEHAGILCNKTLFPGHEFEGLAGFLSRAKSAAPTSSRSSSTLPPPGQDFAIAYEWDGTKQTPEIKWITRPLPPLPAHRDSPSGTILFLTGHQTADWILEIGSFYHIDPEFFRRHLDFLQSSNRSSVTQASQMPSFRKNILNFFVPSVGKHDKSSSRDLSIERSRASDDMRLYLKSLRDRDTDLWPCGTPFVRTFALHSLEEFSIQQAATITLCEGDSRSNWVCLVWLDSGHNLLRGRKGPWMGEDGGQSIAFDPVSLYKPYVSLRKHWSDSVAYPGTLPQSLGTLPYAYGKTIKPSTARNDPFYALNELFTFATTSELHFLNSIEDKITMNTQVSLHKTKDPMKNHADLSYLSRIVGEHVENLSSMLSFVESRVYSRWPRDSGNHAESAAIWLQNDIQYVLNKATALQSKCDREMDIIMTQSALEEARLSVSQNRRVLKLTILASLFAPLAFTTSLFGMNFVEPSAEKGSWLVIVIAIPLVILAITIVTWDQLYIQTLASRISQKFHSTPHTKRNYGI